MSRNVSFVVGRAFDSLPPLDRAQRYRQMAEAAYLLAADAPTPQAKAAHLDFATGWHDLAATLERDLGAEATEAIREAVSPARD
jgi:hypothetical protein